MLQEPAPFVWRQFSLDQCVASCVNLLRSIGDDSTDVSGLKHTWDKYVDAKHSQKSAFILHFPIETFEFYALIPLFHELQQIAVIRIMF